jgi:hypothetical protein
MAWMRLGICHSMAAWNLPYHQQLGRPVGYPPYHLHGPPWFTGMRLRHWYTRLVYPQQRERESVDLGEMMVTVGAGEWGKATGGRGAHVPMWQLTRRCRRRLTCCNSCVDDKWIHERGRIEHKPYFIRQTTGFSEI